MHTEVAIVRMLAAARYDQRPCSARHRAVGRSVVGRMLFLRVCVCDCVRARSCVVRSAGCGKAVTQD